LATKRNAKAIVTATNWKITVPTKKPDTVIPPDVTVIPNPPSVGGVAGGFIFSVLPSSVENPKGIGDKIVDGDVGISWSGVGPGLWGCSFCGTYSAVNVVGALVSLMAVSASPIINKVNGSKVIGTTQDKSKQVLTKKSSSSGDGFPIEQGCEGKCSGIAIVSVTLPNGTTALMPVTCNCTVLLESI